jgi:hypothetical protein
MTDRFLPALYISRKNWKIVTGSYAEIYGKVATELTMATGLPAHM